MTESEVEKTDVGEINAEVKEEAKEEESSNGAAAEGEDTQSGGKKEQIKEEQAQAQDEEHEDILLLGIDFGSSVSVVSSSHPGNRKLPILVQNHVSNVTTPYVPLS
tara:strand:- start:950 stop:1267 length:318 start_codon:yes stop_codon:yes gene_type:complete